MFLNVRDSCKLNVMTISNYFRLSKLFIVVMVGAAVSACGLLETPREEIPLDASREWDLKAGNVWYWGNKFESGCTAWMASERWISVQLVTNSNCSADDRHDRIIGKSVSYSPSDYSDELLFNDYGAWNRDIRNSVNVFDSQGNYLGDRPCPHDVTSQDIFELTSLAKEAAAISTTEGEKKIMERMAARFEMVDLSALSSSQSGCTDAPLRKPVQRL